MKGGTLQITWHGSDPVLTLDFHISSGLLATGGADHDIKLWTVGQGGESQTLPTATFETSLSYHTAAVNVLRFSPTGDHLASGADGGELLIWRLVESSESVNTWKVSKTLRFHLKDVLDLEWSPDSTSLVSGSVDNSVIIWDITKGIPQQVLKDHLHYVQGVAWDPARQYVASISGDRTCRIYSKRNSKSKAQDKNTFVCQNVLVKAEMQKKDEDDTLVAKAIASKHYLFHDETLPSFFRRLAWSPDGSFLLVPSGIHRFSAESALLSTTYIVSRKDLSRPVLQLPGANKPIVAVRFCPLFFTLRPMTQKSESDSSVSDIFKLPYRLVFAVASLNSLFIYDTQNACPLAIFAGLHYAAITDIAWAWDAKFLAVSSQDGFCTLVAFDDGDLGSPLPWTEIPSHIASYLPDIQLAKTKKVIGETQGEVSQTSGEERLISMSSTAKQEVGNDVTAISVELIKPEEDEKFLNACEETVPTPSTADSIRSVLEIEKPAETRPLKIRRIIPTAISAETVLSSEGLGAKHITTRK